MNIVVVEKTIPLEELKTVAQEFYKTMIKGVVDIEQEIVVFGGEYHIDANTKLIEHGSRQNDVWGFNVYLDKPREHWLEYISLINIRPQDKNYDMEVKDLKIRERMKKIIDSKII